MQKQRGFRYRSLVCAVMAALTFSAWRPVTADDTAPIRNTLVYHAAERFSKLEMLEKSSRIIELKSQIKTVDVDDPEVVSVFMVENPVNTRQIRATGLTAGLTNITVVDEFGESFKIEVLVSGDVRHLQTILQQTFPDTAIKATKINETVVLSGYIDQPTQIPSILQVTEQFFPEPINNIQVGGVQQVTLKVSIMEVQRGKIRKLGFNFFDLNDKGYMLSNPGNLVPINTFSAPFGAAPTVGFSPGNTTAMFGFTSVDNLFMGFVEALKEESMLKILADPIVTVKSGERANLLSGGEFPILVPQSLGTLSVEFKSFGVKLDALPIVLGNGRLSLQLVPEVSERDFANSVQLQGNIIPGLTTRRVHTAVEMEFGQTFVLAGLIYDRTTASTFKVPVLGDMPVLGTFFRRTRYDQTETELLIMVTPELADALTPDQVPSKGPGQFTTHPTDRELFLDGSLEIPGYGPICPGCEHNTTIIPPSGLIAPLPENESGLPVNALPPAPPMGTIKAGSPPPAPAASQPGALFRSNPGPGLGKTSGRPALIAPRFTQSSPRNAPVTSLSTNKTVVPPRGATPYRGAGKVSSTNPRSKGVRRVNGTTRPTTPSNIRRAGTVRETRVTSRFGQKRTSRDRSRTQARTQQPQRRQTRSDLRTSNPQTSTSRTSTAKKSFTSEPLKEKPGRASISTSTRRTRPGLIAPQEFKEDSSLFQDESDRP